MSRDAARTCASCGASARSGENTERSGNAAAWCPAACPGAGVDDIDRALQQSVLDLLAQRRDGATICPSEAARAVGGEQWRPLMESARAAARRLVSIGEVEVVQHGMVVDPATARGPIRIRRVG